ncbi:MAG TPA: manganese efflux pump MntP family protein [Dehalococcoidales bacterium]|nr:manganese efflux pump MntP family protein [Dehalococcoidales bacterium]
MELLSVILIALGLSADCFAVALSASIVNRSLTRFQIIRVALSFAIFQAVMPVLGWLAGKTIVDLISNFDHWVAFGLLALVGGHMLWEAFHHRKEEKPPDVSKGWRLILLSVATSIDALAIGLVFAFGDTNIWLAVPVIGVTCFIVSSIGFAIGKKAGELLGKPAEIVGGLILIGIGIKILIEHLVR